MVDNLEEKAEEIKEARSEGEEEAPEESPLEEVRRISKENKELLKKMGEEREKLEELGAEMKVSGRGQAGQSPVKKTQEEIDQEAADKIVNQFNPDPE